MRGRDSFRLATEMSRKHEPRLNITHKGISKRFERFRQHRSIFVGQSFQSIYGQSKPFRNDETWKRVTINIVMRTFVRAEIYHSMQDRYNIETVCLRHRILFLYQSCIIWDIWALSLGDYFVGHYPSLVSYWNLMSDISYDVHQFYRQTIWRVAWVPDMILRSKVIKLLSACKTSWHNDQRHDLVWFFHIFSGYSIYCINSDVKI